MASSLQAIALVYQRLWEVILNKLGNAPLRNRAKRLMREAAGAMKAPWPGFDIVFIAKERIKEAGLTDIVSDMGKVKGKLIKTAQKRHKTPDEAK